MSVVEEALLRVRDLTMMQTFNSRERELGEFEELFARAADGEGRLVLKNLVRPAGSMLSVMEVAYEAFGLDVEGGGGCGRSAGWIDGKVAVPSELVVETGEPYVSKDFRSRGSL